MTLKKRIFRCSAQILSVKNKTDAKNILGFCYISTVASKCLQGDSFWKVLFMSIQYLERNQRSWVPPLVGSYLLCSQQPFSYYRQSGHYISYPLSSSSSICVWRTRLHNASWWKWNGWAFSDGAVSVGFIRYLFCAYVLHNTQLYAFLTSEYGLCLSCLVRRDWGPACCPCSAGGPCWDSVPDWTTRPPCLLPPPCGLAGPPSAPPEPPSQSPRNAWPPCVNNIYYEHFLVKKINPHNPIDTL